VKKILLIGSTGFVGKKLRLELSKKYNLICPLKKRGFDVTKKKKLKKYLNEKIDIVVNLSGQEISNKKKMKDIIYKGNKNILELSNSLKKNITLIYISSSLIYGGSRYIKKENSKKNPYNIYAKSKLHVEKQYLKTKKNYLILRFSNIYGEKSKKGIISLILKSIKNKNLFKFDNIKTFKNFIYVNDVVKTIRVLINKNVKNKIINIGNENIRFKELANMLQKITKNNFEFSNKNLNINLTLSQKIDTSLIKSIINQNSFQNLEKYLKNEIRNR